MRSILRSLAFSLGAIAAVGAMAQQPYTWVITGQVVPCLPGATVNVQTIQGTVPMININVPVDSVNCTFSTTLGIGSTWAMIMLSTQCNGLVTYAYDSTSFNFFLDTAYTTLTLNCGGGNYDCNGVLNGPDVPGAPCNDGDSLTVNDTWDANCGCSGNPLGNYDCLGLLNGPNMPWTPCDDGDSLTVQDIWNANCVCTGTVFGGYDCNGVWNGPAVPGTACTYFINNTPYIGTWSPNCVCQDSLNTLDCLGVPNGPDMPGTPCNDGDSLTVNDVWSWNCICAGNPMGNQYDCLGVLNGPAQPGTVCTDTLNGAIFTGLWTANCICLDSLNFFNDCLGIPFGPNMPGTPCNDGDSLTVQDTWNSNCICTGVVLNAYDCNGVLNGPDVPGAPCDDNDPNTSNDMWDANCACVGSNNAPCQAGFWVFQGYTVDSLNGPQPIPNELWIWNLSSGGTGTYSFFWSFGDGTSSTDPFPTHMYANGGPYLLCLTIDDGNNCTSTYCDSVSVDSNGLYTGFTGGGGQRQQGFTINVQNQVGQGVTDHTIADGIATWPNPALDQLNIALSNMERGQVEVSVTDANGRVMMTERHMLADGRNQLLIGTEGLASGLYLLRIADGHRQVGAGTQMISQRFVKAN